MSDDTQGGDKLELPLETRRCRACGKENMHAVKGRWTGSGHEFIFRCPDCGHERTFVPSGSLGSTTTLALIASALVTAFLFYVRLSGSLLYIFFGGLVALWLGYVAWQWWPHITYPRTGTLDAPPAGEVENADPSDPLQRGITRQEKQSVVMGLLSPIIIIVAVLGAAALIGWLTFDG